MGTSAKDLALGRAAAVNEFISETVVMQRVFRYPLQPSVVASGTYCSVRPFAGPKVMSFAAAQLRSNCSRKLAGQ